MLILSGLLSELLRREVSHYLFLRDRNSHGINIFLRGISRAMMLINAATSKKLAIEDDSGEVFSITTEKSNLDFLPFKEDYPLSCENTISISGALLRADIEHLHSFDQSLGLVSIEDVQNIEQKSEIDEFANLKDFIQVALTNGVNSLSQFLLCEFQRLLTSSLGNLTLTPIDETKADMKKTSISKSGDRHVHPGWEFPDPTYVEAIACEGCYDIPDFSYSGDEFIGHVSENEKRVPISTEKDLWDSDTNEVICQKALLVTQENCLPTQNLNTQKGMYKKKNQRSHLMRTRSQTRVEL
ncbi:unnamed protein product [Cuscuta epithymum]|uniref:Uncharacterized protein n=1 Tax=Cuscuta epithymum TaxID=186058 RepID=A0AAV0D3K9_9ASTE|nr:unnamed protein product [Cuscuta epithymum]